MKKADQEKYLLLSNKYNESDTLNEELSEWLKRNTDISKNKASTIVGVFVSNMYEMGVGIGKYIHMNTYCTLSFHRAFFFTETSRFNHSCSPNAMVAWNEETETKAIKSMSNINIGEEITVNYDWQELNMKVCGVLPFWQYFLQL